MLLVSVYRDQEHLLAYILMTKVTKHPRFLEALGILESKLVNGQVVVERVNPKLAKFALCKKGAPSALGTKRYHEILNNIGR